MPLMIKPSSPVASQPTVTFWGAAQSVTGSMHLVEVGNEKILLDCGRARMRRRRSSRAQVEFPFNPAHISAVILSHAHIDHCGNLPALIEQGFSGPIYCTEATRDLVGIMLGNSARIHQKEQQSERIALGTSFDSDSGAPPSALVARALAQVEAVPPGEKKVHHSQAQIELSEAGHILGSAITHLTLDASQGEVSLTFTGDLGRRGLPFLRPTAPVPAADLLISESTYGGRQHQTLDQIANQFAKVVERSSEADGVVLVPAFSLGRTQVVLYYVNLWMEQGLIPRLPLYVDSPLATDIAEVHQIYASSLASGSVSEKLTKDVRYVRDREESDELTEEKGAHVVIASGGMCDGGRIIKHLRARIDDPRASLVLVSYQAPESLGRRMRSPSSTVYFHGQTWNKWIDVAEISGFSGHADHNDFLTYYAPLAEETSKVCLVHGEPEQSQKLSEGLQGLGFADVRAPERGDQVVIERKAS